MFYFTPIIFFENHIQSYPTPLCVQPSGGGADTCAPVPVPSEAQCQCQCWCSVIYLDTEGYTAVSVQTVAMEETIKQEDSAMEYEEDRYRGLFIIVSQAL